MPLNRQQIQLFLSSLDYTISLLQSNTICWGANLPFFFFSFCIFFFSVNSIRIYFSCNYSSHVPWIPSVNGEWVPLHFHHRRTHTKNVVRFRTSITFANGRITAVRSCDRIRISCRIERKTMPAHIVGHAYKSFFPVLRTLAASAIMCFHPMSFTRAVVVVKTDELISKYMHSVHTLALAHSHKLYLVA